MNRNANGLASRALQEASERKARMVTFYRNGEVFTNGLKVSILPGKDFKSLRHLCDYLTSKTNILRGVRYIFTLNGRRIQSLNELQHNSAYVISGTQNFQYLAYGQQERVQTLNLPESKLPKTSKNSIVLKPLSPKLKAKFFAKPETQFTPKEGRILTIVNSRDPSIVTRVLLNLRTPKSFDGIVRDLGQAVRIRNARRMFTPNGLEVGSLVSCVGYFVKV
ncbi:echinoderm microtubule-associated protein-like CG42247 [Dinothrombium tinctorium]|uniref:Echinoderm microtubule-associated protein-like CG42247 n=1 Tax=Dinothrombium tinctorium TaxID=1965070 RepID=A0A443R8P7_9ACAR|nr:echinoderm microtubule-associated protein-like CG42247 [Dinothrombium tinctorium]